MKLFIEPVDVWLFRDGRPFDAGSDHRAVSLFPPYPSVMQGVIRSHQLVVKGVDLRDGRAIADAVGTAEDYGTLCLRGPFLAQRGTDGKITRYFSIPADAAPWDEAHLRALTPQEPPKGIVTNAPTPLLLWPFESEPTKKEFGRWLIEDDLHKCLRGEPVKAILDSDLFDREARLGIGRDDARRTTKEGALYEVDFVRPKPGVGLWLEVNGYAGWPESGLLRMGGEGRAGCFTLSNASAWPTPPDPLPPRFKIYFATPTYFEDGWQPKDWSCFFQGDVKLVAAAIGRYESIGGFDWAANAHKAARRYVPAGSVYFFASRGKARLKPDLIQNAITDAGAEIGFGQIIITEWKEQ